MPLPFASPERSGDWFLPAPDEAVWVGVLRVELHIPGARSLKDRRMGVAHVRDRVRARHGFAVAEVGHKENHQRAVLAISSVSGEPTPLRSSLDQLAGEIESWGKVLVANRQVELWRALSDPGLPGARGDDRPGPG